MSGGDGLLAGPDGLPRCGWHVGLADYARYHDEEWGRPVADDARLFEKLCLEGFQSGLSWLTILRKREAFRTAFAGFRIERVAAFGEADVERLLGDAGIFRHRGKIVSAINNARRAVELAAESGSLAAHLWSFAPSHADGHARPADWTSLRARTTTPQATALAKDLKRRGWTFVGPTTVYAFMQSVGMVNDHVEGCAFREPSAEAQAAFRRPGTDRAG
mgnify:CR=1 FL=1